MTSIYNFNSASRLTLFRDIVKHCRELAQDAKIQYESHMSFASSLRTSFDNVDSSQTRPNYSSSSSTTAAAIVDKRRQSLNSSKYSASTSDSKANNV